MSGIKLDVISTAVVTEKLKSSDSGIRNNLTIMTAVEKLYEVANKLDSIKFNVVVNKGVYECPNIRESDLPKMKAMDNEQIKSVSTLLGRYASYMLKDIVSVSSNLMNHISSKRKAIVKNQLFILNALKGN
jgi:hypothetical protein